MGDHPKKYVELSSTHTDPARVKREREKARELRKTRWWLDQINRGICHYCQKQFPASELTMDHVVPVARGGSSTKGNIVCACRSCNRDKKLEMPVDSLFEQLERERREREGGGENGHGGSNV
jgi:5-methylcytosine-specific restriction endonuclease McrA